MTFSLEEVKANMKKDKLATVKKFIEANEMLVELADGGKISKVHLFVKLEAACFYFALNKDLVLLLADEDREFVLSLLCNPDYIVCDENVLSKGKTMPIFSILDLVLRCEALKRTKKSSKIVDVCFGRNVDKLASEEESKAVDVLFGPSNKKVIDIRNLLKAKNFTKEERAYFLEKSLTVNEDTLPFIRENNEEFKNTINKMIVGMLTDNLVFDKRIYFEIFVGYLRLYPLFVYAKDAFDFSCFKIAQNAIGLPKFEVDDEEIRRMNEEFRSLSEEHLKLERKLSYLESYVPSSGRILLVKRRLRELEFQLQDYSYLYYDYVHSEKVYNENLFRYVSEAFCQGNIFVYGNGKNPVVKMFVVHGAKIDFFGMMRLHTLTHFIDRSNLNLDVFEKRLIKNESTCK